jgi:hypothetical protein
MGGYKRPKKRLHRDFLYLDDGAVVNALSAIESGKVDEIIEQAKTTSGAGIEGGLGYGPAKIAAKKGKESDVTASLVRTRTAFSAFEAWHQALVSGDALGYLDSWDEETRNELEVGDTIEFSARIEFAPIHKVFAVYLAYADNANKPDSFFKVESKKLPDIVKTARMLRGMLKGADGATSNLIYIFPLSQDSPVMIASLSDQKFVGDKASIDGIYTVVAQVRNLLAPGDKLPAMRAMSDAPRTDKEVEAVSKAVAGLTEAAAGLGVAIADGDSVFAYPHVQMQPIAIFR